MIKKEIKELLYELSPSGYIVSLDLETTGIDKSKDKIIEIGAVKYDIKNGSKEYFSQLINPVVQISEFIEDLTGISNSDVEHMPIIDEVKNEFEEFYCDYENNQHLIIAHNANFDIGFLKSNGFNFNNNIFDTYDLAYTLIDKGDYNLESLASFFNIDVENFHRAKDDSDATIEIFFNLIDLQIGLGELNKDLYQKFSKYNIESFKHFAPVEISKHLANFEFNKNQDNFESEIGKSELSSFPKNVREFFSEKEVGRFIEMFELRSNQLSMSEFIENNLKDKKISLIEASPGTGKTMAYLAPIALKAAEEGIKAVIATNTKALQDQIVNKDWLLINKYLSTVNKKNEINLSILKGRKNYICKKLVKNFIPSNFSELRVFFKIYKWSLSTLNGDISEVDLKNEFPIFLNFSAINESCIKKCTDCYVINARNNAKKSNIILTNHSLAMTSSTTEKSILEDIDLLVIDEAHEILNVATDVFTNKNYFFDFENNFNSILKYESKIENISLDNKRIIDIFKNIKIELENYIEELKLINKAFNETKSSYQGILKIKIDDYNQNFSRDNMFSKSKIINNLIIDFNNEIDTSELRKIIDNNLLNLIGSLESSIENFIVIFDHDNSNIVSWIESDKNDGIIFISSPVNVDSYLRSTIFENQENIILTGATLTSFGTPEEFCKEIGIDNLGNYEIFDSEFDYKNNVLLSIPSNMPEPNDPNYSRSLVDLILNLSTNIDEKILVLFTSYSSLNSVRKGLKDKNFSDFISQGVDGNAQRVISKFKKKGSVLLGTGPLWQGVDFGYDVNIKMLIISKLPFSVPNDPLINARSQKYFEPFLEFFVPDAVRKFKQGYGRLIRSKKDYGSLICADSRILTKNYGDEFIDCIPDYSYIQEPLHEISDHIKSWLDSHE